MLAQPLMSHTPPCLRYAPARSAARASRSYRCRTQRAQNCVISALRDILSTSISVNATAGIADQDRGQEKAPQGILLSNGRHSARDGQARQWPDRQMGNSGFRARLGNRQGRHLAQIIRRPVPGTRRCAVENAKGPPTGTCLPTEACLRSA